MSDFGLFDKLCVLKAWEEKKGYWWQTTEQQLVSSSDNLIHVKNTLTTQINNKISELVEMGQFTLDENESAAWGGVGCGDVEYTVYENANHCRFAILFHDGGSTYHVTLTMNSLFQENTTYMNHVNTIQEECNLLES